MVTPWLRQGRVVYACRDEYGPIEVVDELPARSLHFGTAARQSTMLLAAPTELALAYTHYMALALLFVECPGRALQLGLGGGSLAKYVLAQFPPCRVVAVELRPQVVEIASRFFGLPADPRLEIHITSGGRYLAAGPDRLCSVLFVDMYDGHGMATSQSASSFFGLCRGAMDPKAVLAINMWTGARPTVLGRLRRNLLHAFPSGVIELPVPGKLNTVALAFASPLTRNRWRGARTRARAWRRLGGVDFPALYADLAERV